MIWNFDPVAFSVFSLEVRWYGLSYLLGFFLCLHVGYAISQKIKLNMPQKTFEDLIFGMFLFGVLGGRLGEFLFYSPGTFFSHPLEVFKIWHGGMSIHGGILGVLLFLFWKSQKNKLPFLKLADSIVIPLALALGFGRLANFINGELVGIPTDQTWGVIFPHIDALLRHPSQLYEAGKNFFLAGVLFYGLQKKWWHQTGLLFYSFLLGYGMLRFFIEFFREPDGQLGPLSTGQGLCLLMISGALCGGYKIYKSPSTL